MAFPRRIKKETIVKLITCAALTAGVVALCVFAVQADATRSKLEKEQAARAQTLKQSIVCELEEIGGELERLAATGDPQRAANISMELSNQCASAGSAAVNIADSAQAPRLSSYFARTSGRLLELALKCAGGEACTEDEKKVLRALADEASMLTQSIVNGDAMTQESAEAFAVLRTGGFDVTEQSAWLTAIDFSGCRELYPTEHTDGVLSLYNFEGGGVRVSVAKRGGGVVSYIAPAEYMGEAVCSGERQKTLERAAAAFIKDFGEATLLYSRCRGGEVYCTFAVSESGVLLLDKRISVWVDAAGGQITGMDAADYLTCADAPPEQAPAMTAAAARELLSGEAAETEGVTAYTRQTGLCYAFICKDKIYTVDAQNGSSGVFDPVQKAAAS